MTTQAQQKWTPDMKRLILKDLRTSAKHVFDVLPTVPEVAQPAWLQSKARAAVQPYVAAGGNESDLMFWFGTVFGALVRQTVEEFEVEVPSGS